MSRNLEKRQAKQRLSDGTPRRQAERLGAVLLTAIIQMLVRFGLWDSAKTAWNEFQRWIGNSSRRQREAETFYGQFIREGDLCFDVGANVGNRTAVFLDLGARVIAIEPQLRCAATLVKQYGRNARLVVVAKALGSRPGAGQLMMSPANALSSMSEEWVRTVSATGRFRAFQAHSWKQSTTVPITTLDELIKEFGAPAFCKIDVEGYEAEVLKGLSSVVRALSFEFAPEFNAGTRECLTILASLGPCEFNYSVGESMRFALSSWISAAELERTLATLGDQSIFGDVYVRFLDLGDASDRS